MAKVTVSPKPSLLLELPLGQVLNLPKNNHFYQLPVLFSRPDLVDQAQFILTFGQPEEVYFVSQLTATGSSPSLELATSVSLNQLYDSLAVVPLQQMASLRLLALPPEQAPSLSLLNQHYPDLPLLQLSYAQNKAKLAASSPYDPYRYTVRTDKVQEASPSWSLNLIDRDYEEELEPFVKDRQGRAKQVALSYWDQKKGLKTKIFIRGWYFFDNQPPLQISWRPSHTRNSRWRTSHVFIDKTSQAFFFEGELYKGKQAPIFLKDLTFSSQPSQGLVRRWQEFLDLAQGLEE